MNIRLVLDFPKCGPPFLFLSILSENLKCVSVCVFFVILVYSLLIFVFPMFTKPLRQFHLEIISWENRQTHKHPNRQTDKQTNKHIDSIKVIKHEESYFRGVRIFCTAVYCLWAEFVNKNRCISVRLVSEEIKSINF